MSITVTGYPVRVITENDVTVTYRIPENLERKLPPEVKERWLKDLRSGDFKQGPGCLSMNGEYCCLGVLVRDKLTLEDGTTRSKSYMGRSDYLPRASPEYKWLKDKGHLPVVCHYTTKGNSIDDPNLCVSVDTLDKLNDDLISFNIIAQIIEDLL